MEKPEPRRATAADVPAIAALVAAAFERYVERIGKAPAPMLADYSALLDVGRIWVVECDDAVIGMIVTLVRGDHLVIDTVAVSPHAVGAGLGQVLLARADRDAVEHGLREVRLSTNELMTENLEYYPRRGFRETGRGVEDGYRRVFFAKPVG